MFCDFIMSTVKIIRVWIDDDWCTGHQMCVPEVPGLIEFDDDWGVAKICEDLIPYSEDELCSLVMAAEVCPMRAIKFQLENGMVVTPDNGKFQDLLNAEKVEWRDPGGEKIEEWCPPDSSESHGSWLDTPLSKTSWMILGALLIFFMVFSAYLLIN